MNPITAFVVFALVVAGAVVESMAPGPVGIPLFALAVQLLDEIPHAVLPRTPDKAGPWRPPRPKR